MMDPRDPRMAALMGGGGASAPAMPMGAPSAPQGMPPDEELMGGGGEELAFPDEGMGGMPDEAMAAPDPMDEALMLGTRIAEEREQAHQMIDQASAEMVQQIISMVLQGAQGNAGIPAEGEIA